MRKLRNKLSVKNMVSRNGNLVPNQFIIYYNDKKVFQSYNTIIAYYDSNGLTLDSNATYYSRTTSKYLADFTGMYSAELRQGVKNGTIKAKQLN